MPDPFRMQSSVTLNSILENTSIYSEKDYILQSAYRKKDLDYSQVQSISANKLRELPRLSLETTRYLIIFITWHYCLIKFKIKSFNQTLSVTRNVDITFCKVLMN